MFQAAVPHAWGRTFVRLALQKDMEVVRYRTNIIFL